MLSNIQRTVRNAVFVKQEHKRIPAEEDSLHKIRRDAECFSAMSGFLLEEVRSIVERPPALLPLHPDATKLKAFVENAKPDELSPDLRDAILVYEQASRILDEQHQKINSRDQFTNMSAQLEECIETSNTILLSCNARDKTWHKIQMETRMYQQLEEKKIATEQSLAQFKCGERESMSDDEISVGSGGHSAFEVDIDSIHDRSSVGDKTDPNDAPGPPELPEDDDLDDDLREDKKVLQFGGGTDDAEVGTEPRSELKVSGFGKLKKKFSISPKKASRTTSFRSGMPTDDALVRSENQETPDLRSDPPIKQSWLKLRSPPKKKVEKADDPKEDIKKKEKDRKMKLKAISEMSARMEKHSTRIESLGFMFQEQGKELEAEFERLLGNRMSVLEEIVAEIFHCLSDYGFNGAAAIQLFREYINPLLLSAQERRQSKGLPGRRFSWAEPMDSFASPRPTPQRPAPETWRDTMPTGVKGPEVFSLTTVRGEVNARGRMTDFGTDILDDGSSSSSSSSVPPPTARRGQLRKGPIAKPTRGVFGDVPGRRTPPPEPTRQAVNTREEGAGADEHFRPNQATDPRFDLSREQADGTVEDHRLSVGIS